VKQKEGLRPVEVLDKGSRIKGYFHRFVYLMAGGYSETKVLIELSNGMLRYYDPFYVQFTDRIEQSKPNLTGKERCDQGKEKI
jgi:hypothetical protein